MQNIQDMLTFIRECYGIQSIAVQVLNRIPGKRVCQVRLSTGGSWILRMYQAANDQNAAFSPFSLAHVLLFLEEQQYPATKVIRSLSGEAVITHDSWRCLMTTFVDGAPMDLSPASFYQLGTILGRLHALLLDDDAARVLPPAGMLPVGELAYAQRQLERVESLVSAYLQPRYEELMQAISSTDRLEALPLVCIHNDCHPANSINTPDGQMQLIDWEGAGSGPAVIDVGFLLASSDDAAPWTTLMPSDVYRPNQERIAAIVSGYCQHHMLTSTELERLPDAIRFRSLVYGACHFASAVAEQGREDHPQWWQLRYVAAEEIAALARHCFHRENRR